MEPTKNKWESRAVLNPTAIKHKKTEHLFYRAVDQKGISSIGYVKIKGGEIKK